MAVIEGASPVPSSESGEVGGVVLAVIENKDDLLLYPPENYTTGTVIKYINPLDTNDQEEYVVFQGQWTPTTEIFARLEQVYLKDKLYRKDEIQLFLQMDEFVASVEFFSDLPIPPATYEGGQEVEDGDIAWVEKNEGIYPFRKVAGAYVYVASQTKWKESAQYGAMMAKFLQIDSELDLKANQLTTYTKDEVDTDFYNKTQSDAKFQDLIITVSSEAQMLLLTDIKVGYQVIRTDLSSQIFRLNSLPASTLGNWSQIGGGGDVAFADITGNATDNTSLNTALDDKQDTLISGTNIKTINNNSILGSGDVSITASGALTGISKSSFNYGTLLQFQREGLSTLNSYIYHPQTIYKTFSPTNTTHTIGTFNGVTFSLRTGGSTNANVNLQTSQAVNVFGRRIGYWNGSWSNTTTFNMVANGALSWYIGSQYAAGSIAIHSCLLIVREGTSSLSGQSYYLTTSRGPSDTTIKLTLTFFGA